VNVSLVSSITPDLEELWSRARKDVLAKRGGVALMATLCGSCAESEFLAHVVASSELWSVRDDGLLKGIGIFRQSVVEALYVTPAFRRQKVATTLVKALIASNTSLLDAYALPGDRAMKSLFESLGWKARLLTMRGA
jgi:GNAT superfamily N-acetyltransferase